MGVGFFFDFVFIVVKYKFSFLFFFGKLVVIDIIENVVIVFWILFKFDGGSFIIGYYVERREIIGKWVRVNKIFIIELKYIVIGFYDGNIYEFRVFVENFVGLSSLFLSFDLIKVCRFIKLFGLFINFKLKDKIREIVDLVWIKFFSDGGSFILGYVVEC